MHTLFTFLGTGPDNGQGYVPVRYQLGDWTSAQTPFVQTAIVEYLGADALERVVILTTPQSEARHFSALEASLLALGLPAERIEHIGGLDTNQTPDKQWGWFSELISRVPHRGSLVFDFTHGFRSVPIVFSAALGFLQTVREARLQHAFYGWFERGSPTAPLVDMADFYRIHRWTSAVSQLVDTASADALVRVSQDEPPDGPFSALNDPELISAFQQLTGVLKNIEVSQVAMAADKALGVIARRMDLHAPVTRPLLELVVSKFETLGGASDALLHSAPWYRVQFALCRVLLSHGLAMQAFTVMTETIAAFSLGLLPTESKYARARGAELRKYRRRFGDILPRMLNNNEVDWAFKEGLDQETLNHLRPGWERLKAEGLAEGLCQTSRAIAEIRNGFSHAWTSKEKAPTGGFESRGTELLRDLEGFFVAATGAGILHTV
jgi:CRISPR-associated DxTHG motif protein